MASGGNKNVSVLEAQNYAMGQCGHKNITSGANATPPTGYVYWCLQSDVNSTYSATSDITDSDDLASDSREAGDVRYGRFTTVTVASGRVIGYLAIQED